MKQGLMSSVKTVETVKAVKRATAAKLLAMKEVRTAWKAWAAALNRKDVISTTDEVRVAKAARLVWEAAVIKAERAAKAVVTAKAAETGETP